jgi:hypothetical protein
MAEVLIVVNVKIMIVLFVMSCSFIRVYQCFLKPLLLPSSVYHELNSATSQKMVNKAIRNNCM